MKCYRLATLAVALTVASFAARTAMAQNALSADQKTEMTPDCGNADDGGDGAEFRQRFDGHDGRRRPP
jgi:hypothetical protein